MMTGIAAVILFQHLDMKDPGPDEPQDEKGAGEHHHQSQCRAEQGLDGVGDEYHRDFGVMHRDKEEEYSG
ncbi:MAG: hypothetical protein V8Q30_07590 [Acutalibacteraceae bacterium]